MTDSNTKYLALQLTAEIPADFDVDTFMDQVHRLLGCEPTQPSPPMVCPVLGICSTVVDSVEEAHAWHDAWRVENRVLQYVDNVWMAVDEWCDDCGGDSEDCDCDYL